MAIFGLKVFVLCSTTYWILYGKYSRLKRLLTKVKTILNYTLNSKAKHCCPVEKYLLMVQGSYICYTVSRNLNGRFNNTLC